MGSVYKPLLYGERTPERVLEVLEDWIDWHAYRLASMAPGQVDNLYYQDLAQEGRLAVYRLLEREPEIWAPKLLRLAILYMYAARRRVARSFGLTLSIDCAPMNRCRGRCWWVGLK